MERAAVPRGWVGGAARTPPTSTRRRPGRSGPAARRAVLRRSAPRRPRAALDLFQQRPGDVEVHRQLADLALRIGEAALLDGRRTRLEALMTGLQEVLAPAGDHPGGLPGFPRQGVQALAAQQPQDDLLLAARAPAHLPAALRATAR